MYFIVPHLKPEIVSEKRFSEGMPSIIIHFTLNENRRGNIYSIELSNVGISRLYVKELGWIVGVSLRGRWALICGRAQIKLSPLLRNLKRVDIFRHDLDHLSANNNIKFFTVLKNMKKGSLLLADDVQTNFAFQELLNLLGFDQNKVFLFTGMGSDLVALFINNAIKNPEEGQRI